MQEMETYSEQVLLCEDSCEGVFTGIYEAYARKYELNSTRIGIGEEDELRLFAIYHRIEADEEKAEKVARTIHRLAGMEVYRQLCMALSSTDKEKGQAVFKTVVQIVRMPGQAPRVMERLADVYVHKTFTLFRNVQNEMHHVKEFLRFKELENGVLYSHIGPYNDVIAYLMPHFADRFPLENFMIYDEGRQILAVHPAKREWYMMRGMQVDAKQLTASEGEEKYKELFRYFCHKIAIEERKNLDLQRNMLPLRFRDYMVEFEKNCQK